MNFEFINDPTIQRNFDTLKLNSVNTGGKSVGMRFGADHVNWSGASSLSGTTTVSHGLGKTPVVAFVQSSTVVAHGRPTAIDSDSFDVNLQTVDGSTPAAGSTPFYWLAIG